MKKIFLMLTFAGFTAFAASAQTAPTASTTEEKKEHCPGTTKMCTAAEKAACMKEAKSCAQASSAKACCAKGSAKATSMATQETKADVKKTAATNKK